MEKAVLSKERTCLHCLQLVPENENSDFCCMGCKFIYNTINNLGLDEFYKYRDEQNFKVNAPTNQSFIYLDDPLIKEKHLKRISAKTSEVIFLLEGIHCLGCVWLLERLPKILAGVLNARLNFATAELAVTFDHEIVSLSKIAKTLDSLGYIPHLSNSLDLAQLNEIEKKEDRALLFRLGVAGFCAANTMMLAVSVIQGIFTGIEEQYQNYFAWISFALSLPAVTYSAFPFYKAAWKSLFYKQLHIDLPLSLAIIAAFVLSSYNTFVGNSYIYYDSATALIFLLLVGRIIQSRALRYAKNLSGKSWNLLPTKVNLFRDTSIEEVPVEAVKPGDKVIVYAGERVPVDGVILIGESNLDNSILTGESLPIEIKKGGIVYAGALNISSKLEIESLNFGTENRVNKMLKELVGAIDNKGKYTQFINSLSSYFVFFILSCTLITFLYWMNISYEQAFNNALSLLIVSCPCALGISTPVAMSMAISQATKKGIFFKSRDALEQIRHIDHLFFDKTGTLSEGILKVQNQFYKETFNPLFTSYIKQLLSSSLNHPVSSAIFNYLNLIYPNISKSTDCQNIKTLHGKGIIANTTKGDNILFGSIKWLKETGVIFSKEVENEINNFLRLGYSVAAFSLNSDIKTIYAMIDTPRKESAGLIEQLNKTIPNIWILSGDRQEIVNEFSAKLSIKRENCIGNLYPEQKAKIISQTNGLKAMVGDGVNDAPAMKAADLSIALKGKLEANIEIADIVIAGGSLKELENAFIGANRAFSIIKQNLIISTTYNIFGISCAMLGIVNPLLAAILMPISSLTVITTSIFRKTF